MGQIRSNNEMHPQNAIKMDKQTRTRRGRPKKSAPFNYIILSMVCLRKTVKDLGQRPPLTCAAGVRLHVSSTKRDADRARSVIPPAANMVNLGDVFPDFQADTSTGAIKFHEWLGDSWAILFSHPADYTPVCTTELGRAAQLAPEFAKRGVKMIALSCDDSDSHRGWIEDIKSYIEKKDEFPYPIISDSDRKLAVSLGMVDPDEKDKAGMPLTCRAVFIIGPDKKLKLSMLYPATTGRNFSEILRVVDSLQLTMTKKVATPVDWQSGGQCMVIPSIGDDEAKKLFPEFKKQEVPSGKPYLRFTPQP